MKFSTLATSVCLLFGTSNAADMTRYTAGPGVEPGFRTWLERLYEATEDLYANHTFTDFFVFNTGRWTVGQGPTAITVMGEANIIALKRQLLPPASGQVWSHLPNSTTVFGETPTNKTYQVNGVINKDLAGLVVNGMPVNNCSAQYYQERFTINKYTVNGSVNIAPYAYSLAFYNDYGLQPAMSPTGIPCEGPIA